jgi:glycosyltransferase involved in cell wall biosynthesis
LPEKANDPDMKILFIVPSYKPAYIYGGPTVVIARLAERLVDIGHEVTVYTTTANGKTELDVPVKEPVQVDGVTVRYFKRITGDHTHISPSLWRHVWSTVKEYDVVHIHSWWNILVLGASLVCRLRGVKTILSPHGMFCDYVLNANNGAKKKLIHAVMGKSLLKRTHLHVSSPLEWEECLRIHSGWKGAKIFNLVDLPVGKYERPENEVFTISFLSRIDPKKGLDILLRALSGVSFPYRLQIGGAGEEGYVQQLKKMVTDFKMENNVEWSGWKNSQDKFTFLAGSDLFALTSLNENFAIVVIESLHVGTPVLISNNVGLAGYVEKNELGWITGIEDIDEIRAKITAAYEQKAARKKITNNAPSVIAYDFDETRLATDYVKMYEHATTGKQVI